MNAHKAFQAGAFAAPHGPGVGPAMLVNWLLLALPMAGCSGETAEPVRDYSGYYRTGFEASSFHPDGLDERWWLIGQVPCRGLNIRHDIDGFPSAGWVYLSVRGTVSDKGRHGHLGAYDRKLSVRRVISCRSLLPGELMEPAQFIHAEPAPRVGSIQA
jgi:hypothetical protein